MRYEDVKKANECAVTIERTSEMLEEIEVASASAAITIYMISDRDNWLGKYPRVDIRTSNKSGRTFYLPVSLSGEDADVIINAIATLKKRAEKRLAEL